MHILIVKMKSQDENILKDLTFLAQEVRKEEGCLQFDLITNENEYVVYEKWASKSLWQEHLTSPHMQDFSSRIMKKFTDFSVEDYKEV